jgi:hypothetical protein
METAELVEPRSAARARRARRASARTARRIELLLDWIILVGGIALLVSLFLTWSHQFSPAVLRDLRAAPWLRSVPRDPTAWQVYSAMDVVLALLAAAVIAAALGGGRRFRAGVALAVGVGLAFTLHALSVPPTNGANIYGPALGVAAYVPNAPAAGVGETVAIAALGLALVGLLVSAITE